MSNFVSFFVKTPIKCSINHAVTWILWVKNVQSSFVIEDTAWTRFTKPLYECFSIGTVQNVSPPKATYQKIIALRYQLRVEFKTFFHRNLFFRRKKFTFSFTFSTRADTLKFVSSSSRILLKLIYSNGSVASKSNTLPKWRIPSKKNSTSRPFLSMEALKFK